MLDVLYSFHLFWFSLISTDFQYKTYNSRCRNCYYAFYYERLTDFFSNRVFISNFTCWNELTNFFWVECFDIGSPESYQFYVSRKTLDGSSISVSRIARCLDEDFIVKRDGCTHLYFQHRPQQGLHLYSSYFFYKLRGVCRIDKSYYFLQFSNSIIELLNKVAIINLMLFSKTDGPFMLLRLRFSHRR